jgi:hypothetical protein
MLEEAPTGSFDNLPVKLQNPFDFPRTWEELLFGSYLWPKLLFDPSTIATTPYILKSNVGRNVSPDP